tara:strand:+ start:1284 stop:1460 length:177 start_codon:yes stop_codon:yes gene_type:complete
LNNKMAGNSKRDIVRIESTAGTGYRYTVKKNKRLHPEKLEYKKYDPVIRKHVIFKETK